MNLEELELYKKLGPRAQKLYDGIMARCAITGEGPCQVLEKLKAELDENKRKGAL